MQPGYGKRIAFALLARDWTQADLAREVEVRPNTVSDWVKEKTAGPSGTKLAKVARALNVSEAWLEAGDFPQPPRQGDATTYISAEAPVREAMGLLAGVLAMIEEAKAPTRAVDPIPPGRVRKVAEQRRKYEKGTPADQLRRQQGK